MESSFVGQNYARYRNPRFDGLIERYFTTIPLPERTQALAEIVQHWTDQVVSLGLFFEASPTLVSRRLVNLQPATVGSFNRAWNGYEWDLRD